MREASRGKYYNIPNSTENFLGGQKVSVFFLYNTVPADDFCRPCFVKRVSRGHVRCYLKLCMMVYQIAQKIQLPDNIL